MSILKRKTVTVPTIAERTEQAKTLASNALSVFRQASDDLEVAAQLKTEISDDLHEQAIALSDQISALYSTAYELDTAAEDDLAAALKVRAFFTA